ncbi:MAG: HupE/UreJ family protein [Acidobacteria bacterium]|nr:HupE/UreJ family protein [Acidobacteriota bacterium]
MTGSKLLRLALLIATLVGLAAPVFAHPAPYSYLNLRLNQGQLEASLVVHVIDLAHELNITPVETLLEPSRANSLKETIQNLLRPRLLIETDVQPIDFEVLAVESIPDQQALSLRLGFQTKATPVSLSVNCSLFPYDPLHQTFINVYEDDALTHQDITDKDHAKVEYFIGGAAGDWRSTLAVVKRFVLSGIQHIFAGPDHILFIIGLLLLGGSMRRLLLIVTAFTIAHSVTLTLAALDVLNPPARWIEPIIALSIVYVGIDNLMVGKTGRDVRAWIAFFFGFIHGFGFAGVLKEFGLPRGALGWSLFSFNLGVEIGQVCIVIVAASLLMMLRRRNPVWGDRIAIIGSIVVILAGSFWFIQRVFFQN